MTISDVQSTPGRKCKVKLLINICPSLIPAPIMVEGQTSEAIFSVEHPDHPHLLRPSHTLTCILRLGDSGVQIPQAQTLASTSPYHRSRKQGSSMVVAAGTSKHGSHRSSLKDVRLAYVCVQTTMMALQKPAGDMVLGQMNSQRRASCARRTDSGYMAILGTLGDYPWNLRRC